MDGVLKSEEGESGGGGSDKIVNVNVKVEGGDGEEEAVAHTAGDVEELPDRKKARGMTLEEYEAALDADETFNDLDLVIGDLPGDPISTIDTTH